MAFLYIFILTPILHIAFTKIHVIDLTYNFDNDTTVYWPSTRKNDRFKLIPKVSNGIYEINSIAASEHGGTHIDAPRHFAPGKHGVNEIPMERLVGQLFLVNVSVEAKLDRDLLITQTHIEAAEQAQKRTVDDHIVLFYTGWSKRWPNLNQFLGTNTTNDSLLHFPGLHPNAATWLTTNRKIKSIGIDTASIDNGPSSSFESHKILYKHNIPGFEAVNLNEVHRFKDVDKVMIYALPMKIKDGSGAPLRIVASFDDEDEIKKPCSSSAYTDVNFVILYLCLFVLYYLH
ncbi:kynurenine formamidase-like [Hydractinia symbiolongicarpus]|uniref:kynurenine formamidase-like n=1 Tax=Hydractinia symbiolongicarpus TaxID=13093 RepID=UPI00254EE4CF|nr:kynurenine formamidase-like [Hydractinia symbiolongicarpus]XP_057317596.1 kynurenine formamidase-like [Hydractinia symbiolongicarpus]